MAAIQELHEVTIETSSADSVEEVQQPMQILRK